MATTAPKIDPKDQAQTQTQRERLPLDAYIQDLVSPETGEVLGKGILLDYAGGSWTVEQVFFDGHVASAAGREVRLEWTLTAV